MSKWKLGPTREKRNVNVNKRFFKKSLNKKKSKILPISLKKTKTKKFRSLVNLPFRPPST